MIMFLDPEIRAYIRNRSRNMVYGYCSDSEYFESEYVLEVMMYPSNDTGTKVGLGIISFPE